MAVAILLLVMVPAALLLASANASSGEAQYRVTALSVASSYLDEIQALQSPVAPGSNAPPYDSDTDCGTSMNPAACTVYAAYFGPCIGTTTCQQWPTGPSNSAFTFPTRQVGNITYDITAAGGWCQEMTNGAGTSAQWVEPGSLTTPVTATVLVNGVSTPGQNVYSFYVATKVSWGGSLSGNSGYVVQYAIIPTQHTWPNLSELTTGISTTSTPLCPTGLG